MYIVLKTYAFEIFYKSFSETKMEYHLLQLQERWTPEVFQYYPSCDISIVAKLP